MDQRPPDGTDPTQPVDLNAPAAPPSGPTEPTAPAEPPSSILSADPVFPADASGTGQPPPVVAWAAPPVPLEVPGAPGLVFAGVATRFVAFLIDSILISIPALVISAIQPAPATETMTFEQALNYTDPVTSIVLMGIGLVYFVGFWTGERRATPGMRIMKLQVGSAFEGNTLTLGQAVTRWAFLGQPLGLLALVPGLAGAAATISLIYTIVLLASTAISPTKQGIHDRMARSAVVQPAGAGTSGAATACLVIAIALLALAVFSAVALFLLGGQISAILSEVGDSI